MPAKFPRRAADGTFVVDAVLELAAPLDAGEVDAWLEEWCAANGTWLREWRGAEDKVVKTDRLVLLEAFRRRPTCVRSDVRTLVVRLEGTSAAPYWRDWLAKMVEALSAEYAGLRLREVQDM